MDIGTWLNNERGRLKALAEHFGLTQSAVSQWRTKGVPVGRMRAVRDFTRGEVSLEDMLPAPAGTQADVIDPAAGTGDTNLEAQPHAA